MSKINLQFGENDNIYKIFKTLEKLPTDKKIFINIDSKNNLFENSWWWKQLIDFLESKKIDYQFITYSYKSYNYLKQYTDSVENKENKIADLWNFILSNLKKLSFLHKKLFTKKNISTYFLIFIEWLILFWAFKFFYDLISPSAQILITSNYSKEPFAYNFEFYNSGAKTSRIGIKYDYSTYKKTFPISAPLVSVKAKSSPAKWEATIFNQTNTWFSLKSWTKVSTSNWLQFYITNSVNIPAKSEVAWQVKVVLQALETDLAGNIMWKNWNINSWTNLLINNLPESFWEKKIYLVANQNFSWGFYDWVWQITQQDIDNLTSIAKQKMDSEISGYVRQISYNNENKNTYILPFDELVMFDQSNLILDTKLGSKSDQVKWIYEQSIKIPYINIKDFDAQASSFVSSRTSPNKKFIQIMPWSLNFYYEDKKLLSWGVLIVPTKFDAMIGYDFTKDSDWYFQILKERLKWVSIQEAKEILGSYDQIANSSITLSPPWYDKLPNIKSRINISINKDL